MVEIVVEPTGQIPRLRLDQLDLIQHFKCLRGEQHDNRCLGICDRRANTDTYQCPIFSHQDGWHRCVEIKVLDELKIACTGPRKDGCIGRSRVGVHCRRPLKPHIRITWGKGQRNAVSGNGKRRRQTLAGKGDRSHTKQQRPATRPQFGERIAGGTCGNCLLLPTLIDGCCVENNG